MGYKILGYTVWNGAKWYLRRRSGGRTARRAAVLGIAGVAVAALVVTSRRAASS
jgi:hypothetical protein